MYNSKFCYIGDIMRAVEIKNVSFKYEGYENEVLHNVNTDPTIKFDKYEIKLSEWIQAMNLDIFL